jgi:hypothetical protein
MTKMLPKTNEAILPEDDESRFVYDHKLGRWVDTTESNAEPDPVQDQIAKGPPKIPLLPVDDNNLSSGPAPPTSGPPSLSAAQSANQSFPAAINPNQLSFVRSKQRRYVDILQQK